MERPMSEYAADAPRILRDFLTYISTIQGKSARTAHEYYLDLRLFLRVLKHNKGLVPRELPIDRIAIDDIDIDFLKTVTLSDAYDYLEYMSGERPTQQNSPDTEFGLSVNSRARKVSRDPRILSLSDRQKAFARDQSDGKPRVPDHPQNASGVSDRR